MLRILYGLAKAVLYAVIFCIVFFFSSIILTSALTQAGLSRHHASAVIVFGVVAIGTGLYIVRGRGNG